MNKKDNVIVAKTDIKDIKKEVIEHDAPLHKRGERIKSKCYLCGETMFTAEGRFMPVFDNGRIGLRKNPNQIAYWHKNCRKKGRELVRKGIISLPIINKSTPGKELDKLVFGGAG